jgi:hypothetical protein
MPFFFIAALWLLCVIAGLAILISKRLRFFASYLILCSTFGFLGSLVLSFAAMLFIGEPGTLDQLKAAGAWAPGMVLILGFGAGMFVGGLGGVLVGWLIARVINRRFGLGYANYSN